MNSFKTSLASFFILSAFTFISLPSHATDITRPNGLFFETGKISQDQGNTDLYYATIEPQFSIGGLTAAVDFNYVVDKEFHPRDGGNDSVVVDKIQYLSGKKLRAYYGEIENVTFGSGFIVSNYRSNIRGNVPLNRQRGVELDLSSRKSYIKAFGARSGLYGVRGVRNLGLISVGSTIVSDPDPDFSEYGVDFETRIKGDRVKFYAEGAKIADAGSGFVVGAKAIPLNNFTAKFEVRDFASNFVPSLVDEHYESMSPFDRLINPDGRVMGFFSGIDYRPGSKSTAGITYEQYEGRKPRATFSAKGNITDRINGQIFYAQENFIPNQGWIKQKNSIARGVIDVKVTKKLDVILDYYRAYDDSLNKLSSFAVKTRVDLF